MCDKFRIFGKETMSQSVVGRPWTHKGMTDFWLPTLNFCRWTGKNQKHGVALRWSMRNTLRFLKTCFGQRCRCRRKKYTTLSTTQQYCCVYWWFIYIHFRRSEYRLRFPHSQTTVCSSFLPLFLIPYHLDNNPITDFPPLDHFLCIPSLLV
jgi:hypothetical protein